METVTIKSWICASQKSLGDPVFYNVFNFDPSKVQGGGDFVVVKYVEHVEEVPAEFDIRPAMVKYLEEQRIQLRADFARSITDIERRISELTSIACEVTA